MVRMIRRLLTALQRLQDAEAAIRTQQRAIYESNAAIGALAAELDHTKKRLERLEEEAKQKDDRPFRERLVF